MDIKGVRYSSKSNDNIFYRSENQVKEYKEGENRRPAYH